MGASASFTVVDANLLAGVDCLAGVIGLAIGVSLLLGGCERRRV